MEETCNGWHGGVGMFYARAHYSHTGEWDKYDRVVLCPVHGQVAPELRAELRAQRLAQQSSAPAS